jgi:hypothetical protein
MRCRCMETVRRRSTLYMSVIVTDWTNLETEVLYTIGGAEALYTVRGVEAVRRRSALYTVAEAEMDVVH